MLKVDGKLPYPIILKREPFCRDRSERGENLKLKRKEKNIILLFAIMLTKFQFKIPTERRVNKSQIFLMAKLCGLEEICVCFLRKFSYFLMTPMLSSCREAMAKCHEFLKDFSTFNSPFYLTTHIRSHIRKNKSSLDEQCQIVRRQKKEIEGGETPRKTENSIQLRNEQKRHRETKKVTVARILESLLERQGKKKEINDARAHSCQWNFI